MRLRHLTVTLTTGLAVLLAPASAWAQYGHGSIVGWGRYVVGVDLSAGFDAVAGGGFNMSGTDSKTGGREYLLLFMQGRSIAERL